MDFIYFANKGVNHQHQKTRRGIPRDSPRLVSNLHGPLPITSCVKTYETCEVELWRLLLLADVSVGKTQKSVSAWKILSSGAWICHESFIDSWITPYFVKPFMTTSRFFFACFVTYKKGNVWQLKDDSCLKQSSPYFNPCQVEMETY